MCIYLGTQKPLMTCQGVFLQLFQKKSINSYFFGIFVLATCMVCLIQFLNKISKFDKTHSLIYFFRLCFGLQSHALVSVYLARIFNLQQVLARHAFTLVQGIKRKKRVRTFLQIMLLFGKALATKLSWATVNGIYIIL